MMENKINKADNGVVYLTFPILEDTGIIRHGFSTRLGGVSKGYFSTMNLAYSRGDDKQNVDMNFDLFCEAIGVEKSSCVTSRQTHTINIRRVTANDKGKGVIKETDYANVDGLITNEPGITLIIYCSDCIPVALVDPVHKAIGLVHSGWKGTRGRIAACAVEKMNYEFGSRAEDLICAVGPGVCRSCYEVSKDVADQFKGEAVQIRTTKDGSIIRDPLTGEPKYSLDLKAINKSILMRAGVREDHIQISDFCTACSPNLFFSHRVMGNERGNNAFFLSIKP